MVCRENKARSSVMGVLKRMMASAGYHDYKDHEFQSAIHEYGHQFAAADNPSQEEYTDWLRGMRQQIINDPSISDQEKYRESHKQPGVVTRLDQEIKRIETGRDESGRPLRPEQINGGKHFQSMKHLSAILTRQQEAKQGYHEVYARSMGVTVEQARDRYNALTGMRPEERENTRISLRDGWQERLSVAGLSRKQQADMGQSNEARFALAVMESERVAHVRALPTRSTWDNPNTKSIAYLHPDDPAAQVRCDECGQFGHEGGSCPNQAQVDATSAAYEEYIDARYRLDQQKDAATAAAVGALSDDEIDWDARATRGPGGSVVGYAAPDGRVLATQEEWREHVTEVAAGYSPKEAKQAQKDTDAAKAKWDQAVAALDQARGPVPQVSSAVKAVKYNPDSGALLVTRYGYTRKTDGVTMPDKDYLYVMGRDEYAALEASDSPGRYLSTTTGRKNADGGNSPWTPANEAEAKALLTEQQCPTCGRWASNTSAHQCPVPGGKQGEVDAQTIERARAARERAKLDSLPVNMSEHAPRQLVQDDITGEIRGGTTRFPNPRSMVAARAAGKVGMGGFTTQYYGATVNGRAYTWTDPTTGESLYTARSVKCSVHGPGPCTHIDKAADMMANHYRATRVSGVNPGNPVFRRDAEASTDAAQYRNPTEESYAQIRERRAENADRVIAAAAGDPVRRQAALYPRNSDGEPVQWPRRFAAQGRDVNLTDDGTQTRQAVKAALRESTGRTWLTVPDGRGGFTITSPPWRRNGDGELAGKDRRDLARIMGTRVRGSIKGYYVPADTSWRHEALSRAHGLTPSVLGARRAMRMGDAPGPDA